MSSLKCARNSSARLAWIRDLIARLRPATANSPQIRKSEQRLRIAAPPFWIRPWRACRTVRRGGPAAGPSRRHQPEAQGYDDKEAKVSDGENLLAEVEEDHPVQPMLDEGSRVTPSASCQYSQPVLPRGQRTDKSRDRFGRNRSHGREVGQAKPEVPDKSPATPAADPDHQQPQDDKGDEGGVQHQHTVGGQKIESSLHTHRAHRRRRVISPTTGPAPGRFPPAPAFGRRADRFPA
jgi:hypothetical protein